MRFVLFVDGSNFFGTVMRMNMRVLEYQAFFKHIFRKSVESWKVSFYDEPKLPIELRRIYWYTIGEMDDWDLNEPKSQEYLKAQFDQNLSLRQKYYTEASIRSPHQPDHQIELEAWNLWFTEIKDWYDNKCKAFDKMRRFHHGVQRSTNFLEIIPIARWKVDFFSKSVSEKGLDTALAVDMVGLIDNYDVAIVFSGDADMVPSINYAKSHNKSIGVVEFFEGNSPKDRGKASLSYLQVAADFLVRIYEMDLVQEKLVEKGSELIALDPKARLANWVPKKGR
jgi:uncharacterized LabA/DUF88 family protein